MSEKAQIGVAGLAVMGENLAMNMAGRGIAVAVYNRTASRVDALLTGRAQGKPISGYHSIEDFVDSLARPRKIMLMLKAGPAIDQFVVQLLPFLDQGDIIIDGGNSNYRDTRKRFRMLAAKGIHFIGAGISGGEEGALKGPSIMPGGSISAWPEVEPVFTSIAARVGNNEPCCVWMGPDGAGHFVKMVHNGIEYGDMQLISESYFIMKAMLGLSTDQMHSIFKRWNEGDLGSYLIEITADIFSHKDAGGTPIIDLILDAAGQKGTGKWAVDAALDYGLPLSLISEAVFARCLSALKAQRIAANARLQGPRAAFRGDADQFIGGLEQALYCAKIISYTQGFSLLKTASDAHEWGLDLRSIARIWRGGCIIRSLFLDHISEAFNNDPALENLLFAPYFTEKVNGSQAELRRVVATATSQGIPTPCLSAALAYFDGLRAARLPANLIQAQRDYFGAHTYERIDKPRGEYFHTDWTGSGG